MRNIEHQPLHHMIKRCKGSLLKELRDNNLVAICVIASLSGKHCRKNKVRRKRKRERSKATASASTQTIAEKKEAKSESTVSTSTQTVTEEKGTKGKATVSSSTQTITEEKEAKSEATVSTSTQTVTEEKGTKGAISISTQTVTELEPPKPVAVAATQKSRSKSVRIVTDENAAGPLKPAEETKIEIITRSLSLGELRDLRREFTRQTNESILTWLLRIWDAAANDTSLDGIEARQLGLLSRDVVIDQGIGKTQEPLSFWQ
ncbi:hypothetical protein HGM15179_016482 [Zosterops borbonicus]|uniref:Uncharacterized protein n=1 Tax=Zosterops borbonicus TaxID=364589 RepID=A0A8K1LE93_9PASS|nr:hypothetical protein HGM15179_016482 [Zosterops borbonicus]